MSVPAINEFHRPILEVLLDVDGEVSYPDITRKLNHRLSISEEDLKEKTPAGRSKVTKLKPRWDVHLIGDDDQLGCAGESSHPYLENDPVPSSDPNHLRISPWL